VISTFNCTFNCHLIVYSIEYAYLRIDYCINQLNTSTKRPAIKEVLGFVIPNIHVPLSCNDLHNRMNFFAEYIHFVNVALSWHAIVTPIYDFKIKRLLSLNHCVFIVIRS